MGLTELLWADTDIEVHNIVVGPYANNVYTVRCRATGQALLIDAADEHERLLEICRLLDVRQVVETHGHWDHIQAVPQIRDAGYQVAVTAADAARLPSYDLILEDEEVMEMGKLRLHTILTPGHTEGSICFRVEGKPLLFTGDTLFPGGPGNTTFEGGDFTTIISSLETRLFPLDEHHIVLPGHGTTTTLGIERPHLQEWVDRGW
jgi:glyoxylase-like metal-dependent hydrolase (beta-lactamase superfamily II)